MAYENPTVDGIGELPNTFGNYNGTDTIYDGYALCFDSRTAGLAKDVTNLGATAAARIGRQSILIKPTYQALMDGQFAGVACNCGVSGITGSGSPNGTPINFIPAKHMNQSMAEVTVQNDQNCAISDVLGPLPGTYYFGRGVFPNNAWFIVRETANRSVTAGTVSGNLGWVDINRHPDHVSRHFDHFRNPNVPGVVAGALASHAYFLKGTTVMAIAPLAGAAETVINITEGCGELALLGTTTTEAQMQQIGGQYLLSAGRALFCRQRVKIDNIADEDWFFGLGPPPTQSGGVLTGVSMITDTTAPGGTDYIGFYYDADVDGLGGFQVNIRKASGTLQTAASTYTAANNTYAELAFLATNRAAAALAGNKVVKFFVNGVLSNTFSSTAQDAAFPDTVPLSWVMAGIAGAACGTIDYLEIIEHH